MTSASTRQNNRLLPASAWTRFAGQGFGLRVARPWEGDLLPYDVTTIAVRWRHSDHESTQGGF